MYGGSTGATCAITMTLGTDSLASWAYALLAKAIITVETIPDTHLEIACMSVLGDTAAGGSRFNVVVRLIHAIGKMQRSAKPGT